jgi:aspartate racemase
MKTIGMLGGMSWESSVEYYRVMNSTVREIKGGLHSARCLMYSVEFAELALWMYEGRWDVIESILSEAALKLERAGADFLIIATNTMHQVADEVAAKLSIPLMHIADIAADALLAAGIKKAGLLGTKPTMEMDFYQNKLAARGLEVVTPEPAERNTLHRIIFEELCQGKISDESRRTGLGIIDGLAKQGATGMILGCTELGLLFRPEDSPWPLFDTAILHARAAALKAMA